MQTVYTFQTVSPSIYKEHHLNQISSSSYLPADTRITILSKASTTTSHSKHNMPNTEEDLRSYAKTDKFSKHPTIDVIYKFVLQKVGDEGLKGTGLHDEIHITGPVKGAEIPGSQTQDSLPSTADPDASIALSSRSECIENADSNGFMPCRAEFSWEKYYGTFYCQYDPHTRRLTRFKLDKSSVDPANLDFIMDDSLFDIGHSPMGFHPLHPAVVTGTPIFDDKGRKMLFVDITNSMGWNAKLYGKRYEPEKWIEWMSGLSETEKERLRLDLVMRDE